MRSTVTLGVLTLLVLGLTLRFGLDQVARGASKPRATKETVEGMIVSLSNWGRWGKDDEMGSLNLITPAKRKQAAALVRDGVSVSLAKDFPETGLSQSGFGHKMTSTGESTESTHASDVYSMDYHGLALTHLDALCHLFYKGKMYNGFSQEQVTEKGARRLSVINTKDGFFTRGVLMDMPRLWGVHYLEGSRVIYPENLEAWERKSGVKVESGDVILIRTGRWARQSAEGEQAIMQKAAGLDVSCLPWLKKRNVAIVGSDFATDVLPSGVEGFITPIHLVVITAMGMPILDNCDLEGLSEAANARKRWSFLVTAAPLPVQGGTGSPINPVATF
jgi:kynurenine formamidase